MNPFPSHVTALVALMLLYLWRYLASLNLFTPERRLQLQSLHSSHK